MGDNETTVRLASRADAALYSTHVLGARLGWSGEEREGAPDTYSVDYLRETFLYRDISVAVGADARLFVGKDEDAELDSATQALTGGLRLEGRWFPLERYDMPILANLYIAPYLQASAGAVFQDQQDPDFQAIWNSGVGIGYRSLWGNGYGLNPYWFMASAAVRTARVYAGHENGIGFRLEVGPKREEWNKFLEALVMDSVTSTSGEIVIRGRVDSNGPRELKQNKNFVPVTFSIRGPEGWHKVGTVRSDANGDVFIRIPPDQRPDFLKQVNRFDIKMEFGDVDAHYRVAESHLHVLNDKPVVLVDLAAVLKLPRTRTVQTLYNDIKKKYKAIPSSQSGLQNLKDLGYQIVYVSPIQELNDKKDIDRALLANGLPEAPVMINNLGFDSFERYTNTMGWLRDHEFLDEIIARSRGFYGLPVVGAVVRDNPIYEQAVDKHGLSRMSIPQLKGDKDERAAAYQKYWQDIVDHFNAKKTELTQQAATYTQKWNSDDFDFRLDQLSLSQKRSDNCAELIIDASDAYDRLTGLLKKSEWVILEMFRWRKAKPKKPNEAGEEIATILADLAKDGKRVRVMSDGFGASWWRLKNMPSHLKRIADQPMARVTRYGASEGRVMDFIDRLANRDHRKIFLGEIKDPNHPNGSYVWAFLGGRNLEDAYWEKAREGGSPNKYDNSIVVIGNTVHDIYRGLEEVSHSNKDPKTKKRAPFNADEVATFKPTGDQSCKADTSTIIDDAKGVDLRYMIHTPVKDQNIYRVFLAMMRASDEFMFENNFYPKPDLMRQLIEEKRLHPNKRITYITGTSHRQADLMRDMQVAILLKYGIEVKVRKPEPDDAGKIDPWSQMHVKTFSDGKRLVVGSWNIDQQTQRDLEDMVMIEDRDMIERGILKGRDEGIDYEEWLTSYLPSQMANRSEVEQATLLSRIANWKAVKKAIQTEAGEKRILGRLRLEYIP